MNLPLPSENNAAFLADLQRITQAAHRDRISNVYDLRFDTKEINQEEEATEEYISSLLNLPVDDFLDEEESEDTTTFAIIDSNGLVVSCTNTLSSFFRE